MKTNFNKLALSALLIATGGGANHTLHADSIRDGIVDGGGGNLVEATPLQAREAVFRSWSALVETSDQFFYDLYTYVQTNNLNSNQDVEKLMKQLTWPKVSKDLSKPEEARKIREMFGNDEEYLKLLLEDFVQPREVLQASKIKLVDYPLLVNGKEVDAKVAVNQFGSDIFVSFPRISSKSMSVESLEKELFILWVHEYSHLLGADESLAEIVEDFARKFVTEINPNVRHRVRQSLAMAMMSAESALTNVYFTARDSSSLASVYQYLGLASGIVETSSSFLPNTHNNNSAVRYVPVKPELYDEIIGEIISLRRELMNTRIDIENRSAALDKIQNLRQRLRSLNKKFQIFISGSVHTKFFDENPDGSLKRP